MIANTFKYSLFLTPIAISISAYAVDYLNESQAQKILFPEADSFSKKQVALTDVQLLEIKRLAGVSQRNSKPDIWEAKKSGKIIGYFLKDEVVGKHEYITYAVGISADGIVNGVEIMSYRETHGGEIRGASWLNKFKGKKLADPFKLDVDVPNITGATLSCRNVLDGVKRLLAVNHMLKNE